jgi:hypothetical protein
MTTDTDADIGGRLTPEQRSLRSRLAVHVCHARGLTNTAPARAKFMSRFENEVDPDQRLDPAERARRAEHAKKAHFARLALKSARARKRTVGDFTQQGARSGTS